MSQKANYKELRRAEYPQLGDMIDAICKAYDGDPDELLALMACRKAIKEKHKKTKDAD